MGKPIRKVGGFLHGFMSILLMATRNPAFSNKPVEGKVVYFQEQFAPETRPSQKENSSSNPSVSGGMLVSGMPTVPFYFCTFCMKMRQNMMRIDYTLYSTKYTDMYRYVVYQESSLKSLINYIYMHRKICIIILYIARLMQTAVEAI